MEDTQRDITHRTGAGTSGDDTTDTQNEFETRERNAQEENTRHREEMGHGSANREENGHNDKESEKNGRQRAINTELKGMGDQETTKEQEKHLGEGEKEQRHGECGTTMVGGIPDMPPPLSPRIKTHQQKKEQRHGEYGTTMVGGIPDMPPPLFPRTKPHQNKTDKEEVGDPNAIIRRLQEQLRNMRARVAQHHSESGEGATGVKHAQRRRHGGKSRDQEDTQSTGASPSGRQQRKSDQPNRTPKTTGKRTSGKQKRAQVARETKVKRYFYAVVLARYGPPGVYDSRATVEALEPIKVRRFETEADAVAFLVTYQSRTEETSTWKTPSRHKHKQRQTPRADQLQQSKHRRERTRKDIQTGVDAHEGRRQKQPRHVTGRKHDERTNSPAPSTRGKSQRGGTQKRGSRDGTKRRERSPRLKVDDSICRDQDLHALMDEIDAITMAQDTHARNVLEEIEDITRTRSRHEQDIRDTDDTSLDRGDNHSTGGGTHPKTPERVKPTNDGWDDSDASTTESEGSATLPYNPLTIPQQEHHEYRILARAARQRGETPPPYVDRRDRDIDRAGVAICQDWMAAQRGRRSRQRQEAARDNRRTHTTTSREMRNWEEHGDPGHDFGTTHNAPMGNNVIPDGDRLYNTTAISGHHRDFTMWADVHAHTTHLICSSGPRRRNRIPCPGRKRYRIWFHVPVKYLYNTITQERAHAGVMTPFELCLRDPRASTNPVVMETQHAPVEFTRLPVLDLYLHERPETGEGMKPTMFAYHEARIEAIKRRYWRHTKRNGLTRDNGRRMTSPGWCKRHLKLE